MFHSFQQIEKYILDAGIRKRIAVVSAHDAAALGALSLARRNRIAEGVLIGKADEIEGILTSMGEHPDHYEIIDCPSNIMASMNAAKLLQEGKVDAEMKGLLPSAEFLLPLMNPAAGLMEPGGILSQAGAYYYPDQDRLLFVADCAMNTYPTLDEKAKILRNTITLAKACGVDPVRAAVISAMEQVNPAIPNSEDAAKLAKMDWGDDVKVAGPYALDNALDLETARHKGIEGEVAGRADILLMPDICAGNIFHKCAHYFGHMPASGIVCGASKPIIFNSRSDTDEIKYNSILLACVLSAYLAEEKQRT